MFIEQNVIRVILSHAASLFRLNFAMNSIHKVLTTCPTSMILVTIFYDIISAKGEMSPGTWEFN